MRIFDTRGKDESIIARLNKRSDLQNYKENSAWESFSAREVFEKRRARARQMSDRGKNGKQRSCFFRRGRTTWIYSLFRTSIVSWFSHSPLSSSHPSSNRLFIWQSAFLPNSIVYYALQWCRAGEFLAMVKRIICDNCWIDVKIVYEENREEGNKYNKFTRARLYIYTKRWKLRTLDPRFSAIVIDNRIYISRNWITNKVEN